MFTHLEGIDDELQRRIIDVFINSVYAYDDKIVIYYNVNGSEQVLFIKMPDSTEEPPHGGDPELCNGVRISKEIGSAYRIRTGDLVLERDAS